MINESLYKEKLGGTATKSSETGSYSVGDILNKQIHILPSKFQDKHKESLYGEMAVLLKAGVDVVESLSIVAQQFKQPKKKKQLQDIRESLIHGASLSQAMRNSNQFTDYELFSIQIGEETGQLVDVFSELYDFFKKRILQRRKIISALSYPIIVSITAVFAIAFMLRFLVPMFSNVYKQFGGELPAVTKLVLSISSFLQQNTVWILLFFAVLTTSYFLFRKTVWMQRFLDFLMFRFPLFGQIMQKVYLARFARSMALLLGSGVPLISSLDFTKKMIGRVTMQEYIEQAKTDILQGKSLHQSLSTFWLFPPKFISMMKVGETTNQLPYLFDQLSEQYTNEVEHQTSLINSILEPLLILFLGFVVGFILVALYLPIFELSSNFGI